MYVPTIILTCRPIHYTEVSHINHTNLVITNNRNNT